MNNTKSREVIWGVSAAKINAEHARKHAIEAARQADRAEAHAWSLRMEGLGCLNGGYGWLEVKCHRYGTKACMPLDAIGRPRNTPIWMLEASLKCRSCRRGKYAPPVHRLTEEREITPYVYPEEERWLVAS